ncbi:arsenite efflux transporter metallochaperone ArsD [Lignipirellula cremea]|uniref:arsenite efflux transporter metallochaperone ArsD n=1 Tax=Lignipirellula cremea TaxID=2528010 RepID=UPI0011A5E492
MTKLQVFDRPLCCSSGVCGPEVDPALVSFASDLQWLERQGVQVQRINPAHQSELFAASKIVLAELKQHGSDCLPVVVVNDAVVSRGVFPSRTQLASWTGIPLSSASSLPVMNSGCCDNRGATGNSSSSCC